MKNDLNKNECLPKSKHSESRSWWSWPFLHHQHLDQLGSWASRMLYSAKFRSENRILESDLKSNSSDQNTNLDNYLWFLRFSSSVQNQRGDQRVWRTQRWRPRHSTDEARHDLSRRHLTTLLLRSSCTLSTASLHHVLSAYSRRWLSETRVSKTRRIGLRSPWMIENAAEIPSD